MSEPTTDGLKILARITGDDPELQAAIADEVKACKRREFWQGVREAAARALALPWWKQRRLS